MPEAQAVATSAKREEWPALTGPRGDDPATLAGHHCPLSPA
jgi:hypothetical protein